METASLADFVALADFVLEQAELQASTTKLLLARIDNLDKSLKLRDQIAQMSDPRIARKLRDQLDQFELGVAAKRDSVAFRLKENLTRSELQREKLNAKLKRLRVGLGLQSRRS